MIFQIFKRQNVWFDPTNHVSKGYQSNRSNKGFMAIFNILKFNWTRATLNELQDKIETVYSRSWKSEASTTKDKNK